MTWPDVLRWLALIAGVAASLAGLAWTLGRIFRPIARNAAREATDALYERLRGNDFKHVEDGLKSLGDRIGRMDARLTEMRADLSGRMERMEGRLLAAIQGRGAGAGDPEPAPESPENVSVEVTSTDIIP